MANVDCKCVACEELGRKIDVNSPAIPPVAAFIDSSTLKDAKPEDFSLELEWFKPNGITILPNSRETRITSNTYVFLNIFVMHKTQGLVSMDSVFETNDPQIKLLSSPEWCSKCNRELLSYSPKTGTPFSYCSYSKKLLAKFRIICSSNSHFVDKQLITITAQVKFNGQWLEKSVTNVRINSKKPRDETDPSSFKRRRKRKVSSDSLTTPTSCNTGVLLDSISPSTGPANGNTLVSLKGGFSLDSEVMFGSVKLKPFMQKTEKDDGEEMSSSVDTLLCYSPPGAPGSTVQVYVKDGERISDAKYFVYATPSRKESEIEDKVKVKNSMEDHTGHVIRELSAKYSQLETVVLSVLNGAGSYKTCTTGNEGIMNQLVLKSVLLDIIQAKNTLKELEEGRGGYFGNNAVSAYAKSQGFELAEKNMYDLQERLTSIYNPRSFGYSAFTPYNTRKSSDLLDYLPTKVATYENDIEKENQLLSKRIFTHFAIPTPTREPIPPMQLPREFNSFDAAYDFGVPTSTTKTTTGAGLEKLVAAIETLEKPYP